jgi:hypothetical protein
MPHNVHSIPRFRKSTSCALHKEQFRQYCADPASASDALVADAGCGVSGVRAVTAGGAASAGTGVSAFATGATGVATAATFFAHPVLQIKHETTPQAAKIFGLIFLPLIIY